MYEELIEGADDRSRGFVPAVEWEPRDQHAGVLHLPLHALRNLEGQGGIRAAVGNENGQTLAAGVVGLPRDLVDKRARQQHQRPQRLVGLKRHLRRHHGPLGESPENRGRRGSSALPG